jgi:hypothetical protein
LISSNEHQFNSTTLIAVSNYWKDLGFWPLVLFTKFREFAIILEFLPTNFITPFSLSIRFSSLVGGKIGVETLVGGLINVKTCFHFFSCLSLMLIFCVQCLKRKESAHSNFIACQKNKEGVGGSMNNTFSYNLFEIPSSFSFSMCCRCILPQWQCFLLQLSLCFYLTFTCPLHFSLAQRKLPLACCIFHSCVVYLSTT